MMTCYSAMLAVSLDANGGRVSRIRGRSAVGGRRNARKGQ